MEQPYLKFSIVAWTSASSKLGGISNIEKRWDSTEKGHNCYTMKLNRKCKAVTKSLICFLNKLYEREQKAQKPDIAKGKGKCCHLRATWLIT